MSADTLTRPDEDTTTTSSPPEKFHYVRKDKILESVVEGGHVVALCGEVFPVRKSAKPGSPICPDCEAIYKRLHP